MKDIPEYKGNFLSIWNNCNITPNAAYFLMQKGYCRVHETIKPVLGAGATAGIVADIDKKKFSEIDAEFKNGNLKASMDNGQVTIDLERRCTTCKEIVQLHRNLVIGKINFSRNAKEIINYELEIGQLTANKLCRFETALRIYAGIKAGHLSMQTDCEGIKISEPEEEKTSSLEAFPSDKFAYVENSL